MDPRLSENGKKYFFFFFLSPGEEQCKKNALFRDAYSEEVICHIALAAHFWK